MSRARLFVTLALGVLVLGVALVPPVEPALERTFARDGETALQAARRLASGIDAVIELRLDDEGISSSPPASEAAWLRRISVDLTGRIPSAWEVVAFLESDAPDKRERKVEELLGSEAWARYRAWQLTAAYIGRRPSGGGGGREAPLLLQAWLEGRLAEGARYDDIVREIITAEGFVDDNGAVAFYLRHPTPPDVTGAVSRLFLGTPIQCAQCHDHPYADWSREQFFGMTAFFIRTSNYTKRIDPPPMPKDPKKNGMNNGGMMGKKKAPPPPKRAEEVAADRVRRIKERMRENARYGLRDDRNTEIRIPQAGETDRAMFVRGARAAARPDVIPPQFLFAPIAKKAAPEEQGTTTREAPKASRKSDPSRRIEFADHLAAEGRDRFAKATVNRIWKEMFGRGIVDPVDDLDLGDNTHPELLDLLAADFIASDYDLRHIQRSIALSRTYRRSSKRTEGNEDDETMFSRFYMRPMPPEALIGSILIATGAIDEHLEAGREKRGRHAALNVGQIYDLSQRFTYAFDDDEMGEALDFEASIPQALMFLNGSLVNDGVERGIAELVAMDMAGLRNDSERVQHLYLRTLSRPPSRKEMARASALLKSAGRAEYARQAAFEDLFWALLNSSEFFFNH